MKTKVCLIGLLLLISLIHAKAQSGADTLHYKKVYYFGGTGLAIPMGKTKNTLSTSLFTSSLGLDISLNNPKYYLLPTLYNMKFKYDQLNVDDDYNRILENGNASIYALSLAGGIRRQFERLNTYSYFGPALCLDIESRVQDLGDGKARMEYLYAFSPALKLGVGSDYRFKGFFLGAEVGYIHHFRKIQGNPVNAMTIMVGLKSDITNLKEKVVHVISGNK